MISIIVPTRNSGKYLGLCLSSVISQTSNAWELIVVDSNSDDETVAIANQYGARVVSALANRSHQRNIGAEVAKGDKLLFIDSDMALSPDVVHECEVRLTSEIIGIVIPEIDVGDSYWGRVKAFERRFYRMGSDLEAARCMRRSTFQDVGGFDTGLIGGEDWDLHQRLRSIGTIEHIEEYIHHYNGNARLKDNISKWRLYASTLRDYRTKNPDSSVSQLSLHYRIRTFLKQPHLILCHPILSLGVMVAGLIKWWIYQHPSRVIYSYERPFRDK